MNTILVPLDFSETSENSLKYAVNLANYLSANIILMHINSIPQYNNEYDVFAYSIADSIKANLELLEAKAVEVKRENKLLGNITTYSETGDFQSSLLDYTEKHSVDLIVMGITVYDSKISETLFGSNAISFSKKSKIPVLMIPANYSYKKIKNIAYASQYIEDIKDHTGLIQIKNITSIFNSELYILHVIPENHLINSTESKTDLYVEEKLETVNHKTFILTENNVSHALLDFISAHSMDLIVMEQQKHSFLHNLTHFSNTRELAFESPIPILAIHS